MTGKPGNPIMCSHSDSRATGKPEQREAGRVGGRLMGKLEQRKATAASVDA